MDVMINNYHVSLNNADVVGTGGEGTVFRSTVNGRDLAVKIYHHPDQKRADKLAAFLARTWNLPSSKIALPLGLVRDRQNRNTIGLTMPFVGGGFEVIANLANKRYRSSILVPTQTVVDIFLDGAQTLDQIHQNGLAIGDFNDQNALFRGREMLFLDVDAWQFDTYCCPVGAEQFLAPELYGIDLRLRPIFLPEHDWYAYAVLLFRSLLYVHPYGGVHRNLRHLTERARNRVSVLDSGVTYPQIGLSPDMLDDGLAHAFSKIFSQGERGHFPLGVLEAYGQGLVPCNQCGISYPKSRRQCPVCHARTLVVLTTTTVTRGVTITEFFRTKGSILYTCLRNGVFYTIVREEGKLVLYKKKTNAQPTRTELFAESPGIKLDLMGDTLVANPAGTSKLMLVDVSKDKPTAILQTETSIFIGSRQAMYRTSDRFLFRIVSGNLMFSEIRNNQLIERSVRGVMTNHTWFAVRDETEGDKPIVCGFFQIQNKQLFWLTWEGNNYDNLPVSEMEAGEKLLDISVKFSSSGVLIRRLTKLAGVTYIRTDILSSEGRLIQSYPKVKESDHPTPVLHGQAYTTGILLHATDEGIVQENLTHGTIRTYEATKGHVGQADTLYAYQGGLLIARDNIVVHATIS